MPILIPDYTLHKIIFKPIPETYINHYELDRKYLKVKLLFKYMFVPEIAQI